MTADHSTLSRRGFLRGTASLAVAASLAGCYTSGGGSGGGSVSAGGVGSGYAYEEPAITEDEATHTVRTPDELDAALDEATPNNPTIAWIPADAAINYTGRDRVVKNAAIASNRSVDHPGGIIYSNTMGGSSAAYKGGTVDGVLELGENSRMTGLRYRGPTSAVWDSQVYPGYIPFGSGGPAAREQYRSERHSRGITVTSGSARIDNCEIFGWSTHGISIKCPRSYNRGREQSYPRLQNLSIHDCGMSGHGYGIHVVRGHPICQRLFLNGTRHAIAGFGYPDGGYTLADSFIGPANSLFQLDMHYIGENTGTSSNPDDYNYRYRAGGLIRILRNTFTSSHVMNIAPTESIRQGGNPFAGDPTPAVSIGGVPAKGVVIKGNRFVHSSPSSAISQGNIPGHVETDENGYARFEIGKNQYGLNVNYSIGQG